MIVFPIVPSHWPPACDWRWALRASKKMLTDQEDPKVGRGAKTKRVALTAYSYLFLINLLLVFASLLPHSSYFPSSSSSLHSSGVF